MSTATFIPVGRWIGKESKIKLVIKVNKPLNRGVTRFLQLLELSRIAKKLGNRNFPNSKFGKELEAEIHTTDHVEREIMPGIFNPDGSPQIPPTPYEAGHAFKK